MTARGMSSAVRPIGRASEPASRTPREARSTTTDHGLAAPTPAAPPGTAQTRGCFDGTTITAMGKTGRPLADPARGRMTPRLVHVDDPTWDAVKAAAAAEGVPLAEIVRRALRASVGSAVGDA